MLVSKFIDEIESRVYESPGSDGVQALLEVEAVEAEAEAIGVEAEAVDEIAASTSLVMADQSL